MTALALACCVALAAGEVEDYVSTGAVASNGNVTTFSNDKVVSPVANLARRQDGSWAGQISGHAVDVVVTADGIRGAGLSLAVSTQKGGTRVEGLAFFGPFRLELSRDRIEVRVGQTVDQYRREKDGSWRALSQRTRYPLKLEGQAAGDSPPLAQLVFAFLANGSSQLRAEAR